jgi:hypothetical protein
MNCIKTFTPTNSSTICALQFVGCDWAQILLLWPKTNMHCVLSLLVLGGSALTIVAIGGGKPVTRFGVLAEGISVFIRRTLFASRSMFPSDYCLLGRNFHLMHWGFDSEGLWLWRASLWLKVSMMERSMPHLFFRCTLTFVLHLRKATANLSHSRCIVLMTVIAVLTWASCYGLPGLANLLVTAMM